MAGRTVEQRLDEIEARLQIAELPARYARAVDGRDLDTWVGLFVEDVDCGRYGKGREALRSFIEPSVRTFYRSVHFICGQAVDFVDADTAKGTVYCRAEHEDGDKWVAMAIIYFDTYVRREGQWFFLKRSEKHWYSADVLERPSPPFQLWDKWSDRLPNLPQGFPHWDKFWAGSSVEEIAQVTAQPTSK